MEPSKAAAGTPPEARGSSKKAAAEQSETLSAEDLVEEAGGLSALIEQTSREARQLAEEAREAADHAISSRRDPASVKLDNELDEVIERLRGA